MSYNEEDLIPAYKCTVCHGNCCKDEVAVLKANMKCVCIDCDELNEGNE